MIITIFAPLFHLPTCLKLLFLSSFSQKNTPAAEIKGWLERKEHTDNAVSTETEGNKGRRAESYLDIQMSYEVHATAACAGDNRP